MTKITCPKLMRMAVRMFLLCLVCLISLPCLKAVKCLSSSKSWFRLHKLAESIFLKQSIQFLKILIWEYNFIAKRIPRTNSKISNIILKLYNQTYISKSIIKDLEWTLEYMSKYIALKYYLRSCDFPKMLVLVLLFTIQFSWLQAKSYLNKAVTFSSFHLHCWFWFHKVYNKTMKYDSV